MTNQYDQNKKQIKSKWGNTRDVANNNIINSFYFYALYEITDNNQSKNVICYSLAPMYINITKDTSVNYTIEDSMISKKYKIVIVAFFTCDNKDYLRVISNETIEITKPSYYFLWIIVIFVFISLGIAYGSYLLYKEIKKKEKEIERQKSNLFIEILNKELS